MAIKPETNKSSEKAEVSIRNARKAERAARKSEKNAGRKSVDVRNTKLKRFSAISIILAILAVILLNVFLETAVGDRLSFDLTSNQLMSVGDVSEELLANLNEDVEIVVLTDRETYENSFPFMPALLEEYEQKSSGRVSVDYVDPVAVPTIYDELDPNNVYNLEEGQLAVHNPANGRLKVLEGTDLVVQEMNQQTFQTMVTGYSAESSLSGAINYVTLDTLPMIYMTTGHGEAEFDSDFTYFQNLLENNGFDLGEINLSTSGEVPENASAVVMLAPTSDLTGPESEVLLRYLSTGGGFLFAPGPFATTEFTNLNTVLAEYNIQLINDRIRENDESRVLLDDNHMIAVSAPVSPVSPQAFNNSVLIKDSYYVQAMNNTVEWITVSPLLQTSETSVREIGGSQDNLTGEGRQTVALLSENKGFIDGEDVTQPARAAVLGSASIFADSTFQQIGFTSWYNYLMTFNLMNWLSNDDASSNNLLIRDKEIVSYNLTDVTSPTPLMVSAVVSSIIIPLILIIAAIVIYRRRKHL